MSNPPTLYQKITHRTDVLFDRILYPFARLFSHEFDGVYTQPKQQNDLESLRARIKLIDSRIIKDLAERLKICEEIGLLKLENGIPVMDVGVEKRVEETWCEEAKQLGISETYSIKQMCRLIIAMSREVQEEVIAKETRSKDSE